ncbi:alginate O-acetyltransferase AlgX-related protein [Chryseobacterium taiwanense]|uniref:AlgX/AlgJ SGNH hydrolase-like domain-containing protein n=1 Tax=Chryseobacterium taiwanense TaxID=363331 RepID=A0A0B4E5W0_9FLAO|nr:hypothetical protein [Chryseobacterium taiwanense]KIC62018.1 hypothetical protein RM51_14175 [Chryseobacterium taiwanense]
MIKKFILKTAYFILPAVFLFGISFIGLIRTESPDVLRMGMIPNIYKHYRDRFDLSEKENFERLSKTKKRDFDFLTMGDSFSEQKGYGYNHFLAEEYNTLHVDEFISNNQLQTLISLINGGFFDDYKVKYVVLQNVEREFIDNSKRISFKTKISQSQLDSLIVNHHEKLEKDEKDSEFFSRSTLQFPLYYMPKFFICKDYLSNDLIYNYSLNSKKLFSNKSDKLLFYKYDIISLTESNKLLNVVSLNTILNKISHKLQEKNIRLIVLPSPDKYDMYYDYIANKTNLMKPLFFEHFRPLKKEYLYIDSKEILKRHLNDEPDIYFYDDTHWSPIASKILVKEIKKVIQNR